MLEVWSVSQLAQTVQEAIRAEPRLSDLWLEGEVSNIRLGHGGHLYFTIKDHQAQVRCVMFGGRWRAATLENGHHVLAHGRVDYFIARGDLQFYVDFVEAAGVGIFRAEFERVRKKLEEEGLFDVARKRPLPPFPQRIGVATSPVGAVFHDICNVIGRRWPLAEVVLAPTPVQGAEAVAGIVAAIRRLNEEGVDVIIVARGGGSWEELWPFNEEAVARAIFASRVPVIAGVGHEPDITIADLVADQRAPTPSAAAELAVPDATQMARLIHTHMQTLDTALGRLLDGRRRELRHTLTRLQAHAPTVAAWEQRLAGLWHRLAELSQLQMQRLRQRLDGLRAQLDALNPRAVLARGYAIVQKRGDKVVTSVAHVAPGDALDVFVVDGCFPAEVSQQYGF